MMIVSFTDYDDDDDDDDIVSCTDAHKQDITDKAYS